jgi:Lysylphosphatidylglycerol synthase TM region
LSKQIKILINYFLGPLIFIVLSWSLYAQIKNQPDLPQRWEQIKGSWQQWKFWLVMVLMLLNWGIEARKWQVLVQHVQRFSLLKAFKSVLSGCSITMLTPNRIGEYGGRILYVNEGNRIKAVSLTIVGSISQFLVTMLFGCLGLLYLRFFSHTQAVLPAMWGDVLIYLSVTITLLAALFYLRIGWLVSTLEKVPALHKVVKHIRVLDEFDNVQLIRIFSLSLGRYMVFVLQYLLLLEVMQVELALVTGFWLIAVFYLLLAMAPTIGFVELPIRVSACWLLLQHFTANELGVSATALGIWLINLVVPAIIGSLLILSIKIVKDKNE